MPSVSPKQHRAMEAAKHGHSTIGIPKDVGTEFANADESSGCKACGGKHSGPHRPVPAARAGQKHPLEDWSY